MPIGNYAIFAIGCCLVRGGANSEEQIRRCSLWGLQSETMLTLSVFLKIDTYFWSAEIVLSIASELERESLIFWRCLINTKTLDGGFRYSHAGFVSIKHFDIILAPRECWLVDTPLESDRQTFHCASWTLAVLLLLMLIQPFDQFHIFFPALHPRSHGFYIFRNFTELPPSP